MWIEFRTFPLSYILSPFNFIYLFIFWDGVLLSHLSGLELLVLLSWPPRALGLRQVWATVSGWIFLLLWCYESSTHWVETYFGFWILIFFWAVDSWSWAVAVSSSSHLAKWSHVKTPLLQSAVWHQPIMFTRLGILNAFLIYDI